MPKDLPPPPLQDGIHVIADFSRINPHDNDYEEKWVKRLDIKCRNCKRIAQKIVETPLPERPKGIPRNVTRMPGKFVWDKVINPRNWVQIFVRPTMHYHDSIAGQIKRGKSPELAFMEYDAKFDRSMIEWSCEYDQCAYEIFRVQLAEARIITRQYDGKPPWRVRWHNFKFHIAQAFRSL